MKILMLTPYLPFPPASGGQIRTLSLLKHLSKKHEITLVCLYKDDNEKHYANQLEAYCEKVYVCKRPAKPWTVRNIVKAVFSNLPFLIVRNFSREAKTKIDNILRKEKFDVIHAETFYIMPHIPKTQLPIILVEQTIEYKVYQHFINNLPLFIRFFLQIDIAKLKHSEIFYWNKATAVAAVSDADKKIIEEFIKNTKVKIIPNGAGDDMFINHNCNDTPKNDKKITFLFTGNFYWLQNTEAVNRLTNEIFPEILKNIPEAKLVIAGQNLYNKLERIEHEAITYIDVKPDDEETIKSLYRNSTIFIAPINGPGGTRLKILAAMASKLPVISSQTGVDGLGVVHKKHVLIAQNTNEFVKLAKELLQNPTRMKELREHAFDIVKKNYSWDAIAAKLAREYDQLNKNK